MRGRGEEPQVRIAGDREGLASPGWADSRLYSKRFHSKRGGLFQRMRKVVTGKMRLTALNIEKNVSPWM